VWVIGVLLSLAMVGFIVWALARQSAGEQADMRYVPDDLRRADDGGSAPFTDYGSPMG
jgi:hypothetical protein